MPAIATKMRTADAVAEINTGSDTNAEDCVGRHTLHGTGLVELSATMADTGHLGIHAKMLVLRSLAVTHLIRARTWTANAVPRLHMPPWSC